MAVPCVVQNCSQYGHFKVPQVRFCMKETMKELSKRRRKEWIQRIGRENLTCVRGKSPPRVCGRHFISGCPAALWDESSPDWVPTLHMGHETAQSADPSQSEEAAAMGNPPAVRNAESSEVMTQSNQFTPTTVDQQNNPHDTPTDTDEDFDDELSIKTESSHEEDGQITEPNATELRGSEQENITRGTKPKESYKERTSQAGNSSQQNENEPCVQNIVIKTEPLDVEYERSMGTSEPSLTDTGNASVKTEPIDCVEEEPRTSKQKQKQQRQATSKQDQDCFVIKFEAEEDGNSLRAGGSNKHDNTLSRNLNLSSAVVCLERLDHDIVSALMPHDSAVVKTEPVHFEENFCSENAKKRKLVEAVDEGSSASMPDGSDVEVKAEPVFFEASFCNDAGTSSENSKKRKRVGAEGEGSSRKKRKEVELIQRDSDHGATQLVWVKTNYGEVLRCVPLQQSTDQDVSEQATVVSRAALFKRVQAALHGNSFPTFSGYVPSGRTQKNDHKTAVPEYQKVPLHLRDLNTHKKKKKVGHSADDKSRDGEDSSASDDDLCQASDSSEDEKQPGSNASESPQDEIEVILESSGPAFADSSLNTKLLLIHPDELYPDRRIQPSCDTAAQRSEDTETAASLSLQPSEATHSSNGTPLCDESGSSDRNPLGESLETCQTNPVSAQNVVYPHCECIVSSWFEKEEAELWRCVLVATNHYVKVNNLGLLRFVDKNLFSFSHADQLYVFLPELEFRGLLDPVQEGESLLMELLKTPLIASQLRSMSQHELEYVEQYLWLREHLRCRAWYCRMITPLGVRRLFRGLYHCEGDPRWFVPANALFYRMKLGHHCRWSLLVTPPIYKRNDYSQVVEKTLTREVGYGTTPDCFSDLYQAKGVMVPVRDGGAGTSILHHRLTPFLKVALKNLLTIFRLDNIAKPFCNCDLDVNESNCYRPLNLKSVPFPHVTHISFLNSPDCLHCWKRPFGFFLSVSELVSKGYLPPQDHPTLSVLLRAARMDVDVCVMFEAERMFLHHMKMDVAWRKTPAGGARLELSKDQQQELISQFVETQLRGEEESASRLAQRQEGREDLLVSLIYLRSVYQVLAKMEPAFRDHAEARFFIKQWPHICPLEDSRALFRFAFQDHSTCPSEDRAERRVPRDGESASGASENQQEASCVCGRREDEERTGGMDSGGGETRVKLEVGREKADSQKTQQSRHRGAEQDKSWVVEQTAVTDHTKVGDRSGVESEGDSVRHEHESLVVPLNSEPSTVCAQKKSTLIQEHKKLVKRVKARGVATPKYPLLSKKKKPLGYTSHVVRNGKLIEGENRFHMYKPPSVRWGVGDHLAESGGEGSQEEPSIRPGSSILHGDGKSLQRTGDQRFEGYHSSLKQKGRPSLKTKQPPHWFSAQREVSCSTQTDLPEDNTDTPTCEASGQETGETFPQLLLSYSEELPSLSFKMEQYPRSCTCADKALDKVLKRVSSVQCYWSSFRRMMMSLPQVGQAIVWDCVLDTFTYSGTLHFSLAQLILRRILKNLEVVQAHIPSSVLRKASAEEVDFLTYSCGVNPSTMCEAMETALSYLIPAELLCFLSTLPGLVKERLEQSDIFIHNAGHLCADSAAGLYQGKKENLAMVLQAWSKSDRFQENLNYLEEKRMRDERRGDITLIRLPESDPYRHTSTSQTSKKCPPAKQPNIDENMEKLSDCAVFLRRIKTNELEIQHDPKNTTMYHYCTPTAGGASVVGKTSLTLAEESAPATKTQSAWTNVFEGAMLPKSIKDKTLALKTGMGFRELTSSNVHQWIREKFSTHHLILTGTLTLALGRPGKTSTTLCCFRLDDKLFINWAELSPLLLDVDRVFKLTRCLQVTFYDVPRELSVHLYRHHERSGFLLPGHLWVCISSLNAVSWLGVLDSSCCEASPRMRDHLVKTFQDTSEWGLKLRNLVLLPKGQSLQSSPPAAS